MTERERFCVMVLGMHRSGTSLLAGVLDILGVDFGNKFVAPGSDNPKGYFEDANIVEINKKFLESYGLDTDGIKGRLPDVWIKDQKTEAFKKDIHEIIKNNFGESEVFGFKDPRVSILLPAYIEVLESLNIKPIFIISDRSGIEIAASLEKRNQLSVFKGIKAAKYFKRNIDFYTRSGDFVKVKFDELVSNPEQIIQRINTRFNYLNLKSYEEVREQITDFIDPSLKHHNLNKDNFILTLAERIDKNENKHDEDRKWWSEKLDSLNEITESNVAITKNIENNFKENLEENRRLRSELSNAENKLSKTKDDLKIAINSEIGLRQKIKHIIDDRDGLREMLNSLKKHSIDLHNLVEDSKDKITELGKHNHHLQTLIDEKGVQIEGLNIALTNIERSFTWKVVKAWNIFITLVFPKGSFMHNQYKKILRWNQKILNEWLPGKVVGQMKKSESRVDAGYFWEKFKKEHGDDIDILFINHEESRTGAPRIVFDVADDIKNRKKVAMVSLRKGTMQPDFKEAFGEVIYPDDLYPTYSEEKKVKAILENVKPKLVYSNSISTFRYSEIAKNMGIKTIFHIHELDIAFKIVFNNDQRKRFKDFADKFIAVSQPVYDLLVHKIGCDPKTVELIHAFISRDRIINSSNEIDKNFIDKEIGKEKDDQVVVMGLGMFIYRKGADIFMKTAERLKRKGIDCHFVWIGSKPFKEPFMSDFNRYKDHFTFIGEKQNPFPYLNSADVFALPSREDPFPLVVLESMALGKPSVIFGDAGGIKKAVKDSGIILKDMTVDAFSDAIEKIVIDNELRKDLSSKAIDNQSMYDITVVLPKIDSLVTNLLKEEDGK